MARATKIEWCTATWNPWYGCHKVSPACDNCYAESWAKRTGHDFGLVTRSKTTFNDPQKWKQPERVFTCSLSDFFHPAADKWRREAWRVMVTRAGRLHTYLVLSKRIERWFVGHACPFPNLTKRRLWLGVTAENQEQADNRIPALLEIDQVPVRFVSCEPLLGRIDLSPYLRLTLARDQRVDWVIVGGESGPKYRPLEESWVKDIQIQCAKADVPFFFKQWAGVRPEELGRLFMGREWNEIPEL
jgi:protein gp37